MDCILFFHSCWEEKVGQFLKSAICFQISNNCWLFVYFEWLYIYIYILFYMHYLYFLTSVSRCIVFGILHFITGIFWSFMATDKEKWVLCDTLVQENGDLWKCMQSWSVHDKLITHWIQGLLVCTILQTFVTFYIDNDY